MWSKTRTNSVLELAARMMASKLADGWRIGVHCTDEMNEYGIVMPPGMRMARIPLMQQVKTYDILTTSVANLLTQGYKSIDSCKLVSQMRSRFPLVFLVISGFRYSSCIWIGVTQHKAYVLTHGRIATRQPTQPFTFTSRQAHAVRLQCPSLQSILP